MGDVLNLIVEYARLGLYRHIQTVCTEVRKKKGKDPNLIFWGAYGYGYEGNPAEAIRELDSLRGRREAELPALVLAADLHRRAKTVDRVALRAVEDDIPRAESQAGERGRVLNAHYLLLSGNVQAAVKNAEAAIAASAESPAAHAAMGWCLVAQARGLCDSEAEGGASRGHVSRGVVQLAQRALDSFRRAAGLVASGGAGGGAGAGASAGAGKKDLGVEMGMANALVACGKAEEAVGVLGELQVRASWFMPAYGARGRILSVGRQWGAVQEQVDKALGQDPLDLESLRLAVLRGLLQEGAQSAMGGTVGRLESLCRAIKKHEPANVELLLRVCQPFARLSGGAASILKLTLELARLARTVDPGSSEAAAECGRQEALLGSYAAAAGSFREAAKRDEGNVEALWGAIYCQIKLGDLEDAAAQLELFRMVQASGGRSSKVALLDALLAWHKDRDAVAQLKALDETRALLRQELEAARARALVGSTTIFELLSIWDPQLRLEVAGEYLQHAEVEDDDVHASGSPGGSSGAGADDELGFAGPAAGGSLSDSAGAAALRKRALTAGLELLSEVSDLAPGLTQARLMMAQTHFRKGNLDEAQRALVSCLKVDPSFADAHLLMAQVALAKDDVQGAKASLDEAVAYEFKVRQRPAFQMVHARVLLGEQKFAEAVDALEAARKANRAQIDAALEAARKAAEDKKAGRSSVGGSRPGPASGAGAGAGGGAAAGSGGAAGGGAGSLSRKELLELLVLLAEALTALGKVDEASEVAREAAVLGKGSGSEVKVLVAQSKIALAKGDVDRALRKLGSVPYTDPAFRTAQLVRAEVYLRYRRDRSRFVRCYSELAEKRPGPRSLVALAGAYLRVQMPDEAVEALHKALAMAPDDPVLVRKVGRALVATHDYRGAAEYYETALDRQLTGFGGEGRGPSAIAAAAAALVKRRGASLDAPVRASLRTELTELYVKMRRFEEAAGLVAEALADEATGSDAAALEGTVRALRLMARVQLGVGDAPAAEETLRQALTVQDKVSAALREDAPELVQGARRTAAEICHEVGQLCEEAADGGISSAAAPPGAAETAATEGGGFEQRALTNYREALRRDETHQESMLALARLLIRTQELPEAELVLGRLQAAAPGLEEAGILLGDLKFAQGEPSEAVVRYQKVLEEHPTRYDALSKFIVLLRRSSRIEEAKRFMDLAKAASPRAESDAGFCYCQGLLHRARREPTEAISSFNQARHSGRWGLQAIEAMVDVYVCPEGDDLWADAGTVARQEAEDGAQAGAGRGGVQARGGAGAGAGGAGATKGEARDAEQRQARWRDNSRSALALLRTIPPRMRKAHHDVLAALATMVPRSSEALGEAQGLLEGVLARQPQNVPALLGLATAHLLAGRVPKARTALKTLVSAKFDAESADYFVRAWLLLADLFIGQGKHDHALQLCQQALKHDSSSGKAWEHLGAIMEREGAYADAAGHYERAWALEQEQSAQVGYKLAFNYLKARRFTRAIDVCHKVLKTFPDYGAIKRDVLDRARGNLRNPKPE